MLADCKVTTRDHLKIKWDGWLLTASVNAIGNAFGLHDENYIHNGMTLVNPMDSLVRVIQLGSDVASLQL